MYILIWIIMETTGSTASDTHTKIETGSAEFKTEANCIAAGVNVQSTIGSYSNMVNVTFSCNKK